MRGFEKISFNEFKQSVKDDKKLYEEFKLPKRGTMAAGGYDFFLIEDLTIKPNEIKIVPTGIKSYFMEDEALLLIVRSKTGFKYNIRLCNQVGLIDSDYYNNEDNEGHIFYAIQNEGKEEKTFKKGEAIIQGMFIKYLTVSDEINDFSKRKSTYKTGK